VKRRDFIAATGRCMQSIYELIRDISTVIH
jgi:hypothetical protein